MSNTGNVRKPHYTRLCYMQTAFAAGYHDGSKQLPFDDSWERQKSTTRHGKTVLSGPNPMFCYERGRHFAAHIKRVMGDTPSLYRGKGVNRELFGWWESALQTRTII